MVDRHLLGGVHDVARDRLAIDGIRNRDGPAPGDEAEVAHVLEIVEGDRFGGFGAAQQRLDHPAHPILPQLVGELIEVRLPAEDELLASTVDRTIGDRP